MRRCDPGVAEIKERIADGRIRLPVKAVVWYSKGMFNNGSHFVNLLEHWLGPAGEFESSNEGRLWDGADPEPDGVIGFAGGRAWFLAAREEQFSHYTVELIAENGRLRYDDGGARITWQGVVDDPACAGYRVLDAAPENSPSDLNRIQWHVADHLSAQLAGRASAICSGDDALRTLESLLSLRGARALEVSPQ
jgi:predicted dehydrogenase